MIVHARISMIVSTIMAVMLPMMTAFSINADEGSRRIQQDGLSSSVLSAPQRLQLLLQQEMDGTRISYHNNNNNNNNTKTPSTTPILLPCCYDGLSARLVARAGFDATFMTGFGVSAIHGMPDTQLISYTEMQQACYHVQEGLVHAALEKQQPPIPCIADGDTGYGNAMNVKRTIHGYALAGMAGVMIEDQVSPKRCGHVIGKSIISFHEAVQRIKAAVDARDECLLAYGKPGPLILARTDAVAVNGFEDAIERCHAFIEAGADMTFLEAPESIEQMYDYCSRVPGPKLANMLEQGTTPIVSPQELKKMGYTMAAYPLTLLSSSIKAMEQSLQRIAAGETTDDLIVPFQKTKDAVGFSWYAQDEKKYK